MVNSKWNLRFLVLAHEIGRWSKDPSSRVGCLVIDDNRNHLSMGYNGFPRGVPDDPEMLANREIKYKIIVHAEANAIASAARNGHSLDGGTMFTKMFPCSQCASLIIQAGIKCVVYVENKDYEERWKDSVSVSKTMFSQVGVQVVRYSEPEFLGYLRAPDEVASAEPLQFSPPPLN